MWNPPNHVKEILESEGVIGIGGTGRSGKTALGHLLASYSSKPKYVISYPDSAIKLCPPDWSSINTKDVFSLSLIHN